MIVSRWRKYTRFQRILGLLVDASSIQPTCHTGKRTLVFTPSVNAAKRLSMQFLQRLIIPALLLVFPLSWAPRKAFAAGNTMRTWMFRLYVVPVRYMFPSRLRRPRSSDLPCRLLSLWYASNLRWIAHQSSAAETTSLANMLHNTVSPNVTLSLPTILTFRKDNSHCLCDYGTSRTLAVLGSGYHY